MSIISKIFDICLFVPLQKRRATFNQALDSGEMSHEIPVSEAQDLLAKPHFYHKNLSASKLH